jgi:hypothetical protein
MEFKKTKIISLECWDKDYEVKRNGNSLTFKIEELNKEKLIKEKKIWSEFVNENNDIYIIPGYFENCENYYQTTNPYIKFNCRINLYNIIPKLDLKRAFIDYLKTKDIKTEALDIMIHLKEYPSLSLNHAKKVMIDYITEKYEWNNLLYEDLDEFFENYF